MAKALQAAGVLRDQLKAAGLGSGRIDLPGLWPTLTRWLRLPVIDVSDDASYVLMLFSRQPADSGGESLFAGEPPAAIAGRDLVCLELGRDLSRLGPSARECVAAAGIAVWFADSPGWQSLSSEDGWIEMGVTTPNLDWGYPAPRVQQFIADLERSRVLDLAFTQPPLLLEIYDSERENGTVYLGR